ncbi:hypothetical protein C1646_776968 [Rhizophagus diaphanus]|nr:hypothetical protein C1646_776968 [Rhizophagus diaphanus] [Rhizophagus sp. MUCL 43196]
MKVLTKDLYNNYIKEINADPIDLLRSPIDDKESEISDKKELFDNDNDEQDVYQPDCSPNCNLDACIILLANDKLQDLYNKHLPSSHPAKQHQQPLSFPSISTSPPHSFQEEIGVDSVDPIPAINWTVISNTLLTFLASEM